jgi:hypothetical protein
MHAFEQAHAFEQPADANFVICSDDESDSGDEGSLTPLSASQELADLLANLKLKGKLSSRDVCIIAFLGKAAGLQGAATDFALRPSSSSGHFHRHFKKVLKLDAVVEGDYTLPVPGQARFSIERSLHPIPVLVPHETLAAELAASPALVGRLQNSIREQEWSDAYYSHEVVRSANPGEVVWPISVYIDGVPFAKRDGLLGLWVYGMVSQERHLILTLRKSELCRCGCLSWCSLYVMWSFLTWSLKALAEGVYPAVRHDGSPFGPSEAHRQAQANQPMMKAALIHIKGDWAEIVHCFGFCSWSSVLNPCWCCWASKDQLPDVRNTSVCDGPCPEKSPADYELACSSCEKLVTVANALQQASLIGLLLYDQRRGSAAGRGRCLRGNYDPLALRQGDRLEPSSWLTDVGGFEHLEPPFQVVFWRSQNEPICKHRCEVFSIPGVTLLSLAIDILHTLHLGVYKSYCMTAIWACIDKDVWNTNALSADVRVASSCRRLREDLFAWYKQKRRDDPEEPLYVLSDLTPNMIGTAAKHCLSTKAAETGTLLEFARDLVRTHRVKIGVKASALLLVGDALVQIRNCMRAASKRLTPGQAQEMVDLAKAAMAHRSAAGIPFSPKWHLMLHIVAKAWVWGNPAHYSIFLTSLSMGSLPKWQGPATG